MAPALTLREASMEDLESIVDIAIAAMPLDPQWDYRFPYRRKYPKDHRKGTRRMFQSFLEPKVDWKVMLAELRDPDGLTPARCTALAVWNITNLNSSRLAPESGSMKQKIAMPQESVAHQHPCKTTVSDLDHRRDCNPEHMAAFSNTVQRSQAKYFDQVYGQSYFFLQILATHPDYQGRGAGTRLVKWGMAIAQERQMKIGLMASPMGKRLYSYLGFHSLGSANVKVPCESESVNIGVMVFE